MREEERVRAAGCLRLELHCLHVMLSFGYDDKRNWWVCGRATPLNRWTR